MANHLDLARSYLGLVGGIGQRGALSEDPSCNGYVLQELSRVLSERTGQDGRALEPTPDLQKVLEELEWVHSLFPSL
jgi:hypothetical protein